MNKRDELRFIQPKRPLYNHTLVLGWEDPQKARSDVGQLVRGREQVQSGSAVA